LGQFMAVCPKRVCISTVSVNTNNYIRDPNKVALTDFFGNVVAVELIRTDESTQVDKIDITSDEKSYNRSEYKLKSKEVDHKWHYVTPFPFTLI